MNITTRALHLADAAVALAKVSTTRADDIKLYDEALTVIREAKGEQFTNQCGETCERATLCIGCSKQLTEADRKYQPEKQEPVGYTAQSVIDWLSSDERTDVAEAEIRLKKKPSGRSNVPLYATPVKREWVDLTDDELLAALISVDSSTARLPIGFKLFARAVIAAFKAKNNL